MALYRDDMANLIKRTLLDPRGAARQIIDLRLPQPVLWNALLLVIIMSVLLTYGTVILAGQEALIIQMAGSPLVFALFMAGQMVLLIFALLWTGKIIGGKGTLEAFAALIAWLQTLWLLAQIIQTVIMVFAPAASAMIGIVSVVYGLWVLIQFIAEAHEFPNWIKGVGVMAMSILGVVAGVSLLLSIIGISTIGLAGNV
ncbi:MAG: Yip1 family protein [Paracoccaceae bacterium]|nr:Yip1 family protein [Paracoccaceae bacterium]MDG2260435.1 Yip1 family protein [Paracoccaceae bacterium]